MNANILNEEVQAFIKENESTDFREISLRKSPFYSVSSALLAQQIKGRQIAKHKFPFLYETDCVYFPPSLNLEQASSATTAQYKANIINGKTIIDLTAGFGIDTYAFAQSFEKVIYVEQNAMLNIIAKHNFKQLKQNNIKCFSGHFQDYFKINTKETFDVIYLDPSRRNASVRKVILEDLEPNILEWIPRLLEKSNQILIKLSPLLDLTSTLEKIKQIDEIHFVAVKNEMKELLISIRKDISIDSPKITCINLESEQLPFSYFFNEEAESLSSLSKVDKYIYQPNVAILKAGAFKLITQRFPLRFPLRKLHTNTHLYTLDTVFDNFPGKIFEVKEIIQNPKKEIMKKQFNLLVKNFPQSVETIKKKFKIKDGGDKTLIFTQDIEGIKILLAERKT